MLTVFFSSPFGIHLYTLQLSQHCHISKFLCAVVAKFELGLRLHHKSFGGVQTCGCKGMTPDIPMHPQFCTCHSCTAASTIINPEIELLLGQNQRLSQMQYRKTTWLQFSCKIIFELLIQTPKSCIEEYLQHLHKHSKCCNIMESRFLNKKKQTPWSLIIVFLQIYCSPECRWICMHEILSSVITLSNCDGVLWGL